MNGPDNGLRSWPELCSDSLFDYLVCESSQASEAGVLKIWNAVVHPTDTTSPMTVQKSWDITTKAQPRKLCSREYTSRYARNNRVRQQLQ